MTILPNVSCTQQLHETVSYDFRLLISGHILMGDPIRQELVPR